jgi:hypothetical protein
MLERKYQVTIAVAVLGVVGAIIAELALSGVRQLPGPRHEPQVLRQVRRGAPMRPRPGRPTVRFMRAAPGCGPWVVVDSIAVLTVLPV